MITPLKNLSRDQIRELCAAKGLPNFRSKQLLEWLYKKGAHSYDEMSNLPKGLREQLANDYPIFSMEVIDKQVSLDGTRKFLLGFHEGYVAECVGIPASDNRLTVCCSSQAGCAMRCDFCATGKQGFTANLSIGEIVDQILLVQNEFGRRVTNIVVMGQGEPFLNFNNVIEALRICNDDSLIGIGARKITVSSCGIIPGIKQFSNIDEQFTLAVSLHSAVQRTRDRIMPGVSHYPLDKLHKKLAHYVANTNRRITFEYALMQGVNDSEDDLKALIDYCADLLCHVNLIPLNEIEGSSYLPVSQSTMDHWCNELIANGTEASIRNSRGSDIAGACGQLANSKRTNS
jgi:23S rRNA (adenine2503-C2)-methyltransferase